MAGFMDRLLPAPPTGGFRRDDCWVWCGSVVRGGDGRYHMFASMWEKEVPFRRHWLTNSRVVRAVSDTPAGPYAYAGEVLPPRGGEWWDGKMTHNPTIHKAGETYLLYYTGTTYDGPQPSAGDLRCEEANLFAQARANQRVGMATAPAPEGPWTRRDAPVLPPRPGKWDGLMTTNPAPLVLDDGRVLLLYKAVGGQQDKLTYGVALAESFDAPYRRLRDDPLLFSDDPEASYEDAYVWFENGLYRMIFNDLSGHVTGEVRAGGYAVSEDMVTWRLADEPKAYSRTVRFADGSEQTFGNFERPQLLIEDGRPTHLFCAAADKGGWFADAEKTWSQAVPLTTETSA